MTALNHQFRLAASPVGRPTAADWTYAEEPVPEPAESQVLGFELAVCIASEPLVWTMLSG
jgi:hypothetical protein